MAQPCVSTAWRSIALAVAPLLYLRHYQTTFGYDPAVVWFGWGLMAFVVVSTYAVFFLLAWFALRASPSQPEPGRPWAKPFCVALTAAGVGIGLIHLLTYVSNRAWGDALTAEVAIALAREPASLIEFLPLPAWGQLGLLAGVALAIAILAACAWLTAHRLGRSLFAGVANWAFGDARREVRRRRSLRLFGVLGLTIALAGASLVHLAVRMPGRLVGEPISSFLMWFPPASDTLHLDHHRMQAAFEDRVARAEYPVAASFDEKNVVLILADSMRADRMGVYGYERDTTPFLTALHRRGSLHRVDMALSTCSDSYCGIATTFTSRPFHETSSKSFKLPGLLKSLGYRVDALVSGEHRSWKLLGELYGSDFDRVHDHEVDEAHGMNDDRLILDGLRRVEPYSGQPSFFYFFLMSSHVLGVRQPEYQRYLPDEFDGIASFWNEVSGTRRVEKRVVEIDPIESTELTVLSNRYDNGIVQADAMIAEIFTQLEHKGYLENAIVVILSDHGDGLAEHDHLGHTRYLYQEDIRIPLLIYDRGVSAYAGDPFATQIDVAPTILDRLGLPIPATWQGRSLLRPARERATLHQTRRGQRACRAVVADRGAALFKYIRCGSQPPSMSEELYELTSDPGEQTDLLATVEPAWLDRLRSEIDSRFALHTNRCDAFDCVD